LKLPSSFSFIPSLCSWNSFIFPLTYMHTQYFHHIHPPTPFPPPSHRYQPSQTGPILPSCSPI
jgi:hypothetical protein